MKFPLILTNFKAYESSVGAAALDLALIHAKVMAETGASLAVAVQPSDIFQVASAVAMPVFAQHIDPVDYGAHTGAISSEAVKAAGAFGTLLNHSERRLPMDVLKSSIQRAKEVGLFVVACAKDVEEGVEIAAMGPDLVAVEPPELIGGEISVSTARPEVIRDAVERIGKGKVLVGAGVKNAEDVRIALELGACGVLLASGITKASDPEGVLRGLVGGFKA